MKRLLTCLLALLVFLSLGSGLYAQGKLYLGVLVGLSSQSPKLPTGSIDEFTKESSVFYGARAGIKLLLFTVEGVYFRAAHKLIQDTVGDVDWNGKDLNYQFIGANLKFTPISIPLPSVASFNIFASGGYGVYTADIKTVDKDTNGGFNFGGGIELKLSKISVLAEGKYNLRSKFTIGNEELDLGNYTINAGINIYF